MSELRIDFNTTDEQLLSLLTDKNKVPDLNAVSHLIVESHENEFSIIGDNSLQLIASKLPNLTSLDLSKCNPGVTDSGVDLICSKLPKLTFLDLTGCGSLTDASLQSIAAKAANLKSLTVSGSRNTDVGVEALASSKDLAANLIYLRLASCSKITDASLEAIASNLTALTTLDLFDCSKITASGLQSIGKKLTGLTTLSLKACKQIDNDALASITPSLANLTSLSLRSCNQVTGKGIKCVATNLSSNLASLDIANCNTDTITDDSVQALVTSAPNLQELDFTRCKFLTNASLESMAAHLPKLSALCLEDVAKECSGSAGRIHDAGLQALASPSSKIENLGSLNLRGCMNTTDAGIQAITAKFIHLMDLDLTACVKITDATLEAIAANKLIGLVTLKIGLCELITDAGIKHIANASSENKFVNLKLLDVASNKQITDVGVGAVLTNLPGLTSLNIQYLRNVSSKAFEEAKASSSLRCLNIMGCEQIDDEALGLIGQKFPNLSRFNAGYCSGITDVGKKNLKAHYLKSQVRDLHIDEY